MKRTLSCLLIIILFFLQAACTNEESLDLGPKKEVSEFISKTYKAAKNSTLSVDSDYGNIYIYCWDNSEIKFDVKKKIRGIGDRNKLERKLKDLKIETNSSESVTSLISRYEGDKNNPIDNSIDVNIYVPRNSGDISLRLNTGTIKVIDSIKCNLKTDVKMANVDISGMEGEIHALAQMGNVRVGSGKIINGSNIKLEQGNISVKADLSNMRDGQFETGLGNIELQVEKNSQVEFETIGEVETNEFKNRVMEEFSGKIRLSTSMGKISIRKY
ncbi:hypothetical protein [Pseudobacteroides cellulosolvens]|uniref:Adhesin domain-containing protein n=1 Tax=Pseudobacteroides cellulosolvens ATCC 35603 = DSM 2933 TaxID=398512 RepID=A0A0L6JHV2_9FIRM|nr:hypothetical protein [Pseudobacteroides cellulosolvens]KNY25062.1 protein of unknown function DUF4098 [Pseudobacteroides cellulosolvens ATCC 35603 = DSM 2933]